MRVWGLAAALSLVGCAQTVHSQVSSYHQLPRDRHGLTYAIVPLAQQRRDPRFQAYEERVRAHLNANGFVPRPFERADYVVVMAYAADERSDAISSHPIIGQSGSAQSRMTGTLESYSPTSSYSSTAARTPAHDIADEQTDGGEPTSVLRLDIVRRAALELGRLEKVYEGEALSVDGDADVSSILPALIEALFQDFPGTDGQVRHVTSRSVPSLEELGAIRPAHHAAR